MPDVLPYGLNLAAPMQYNDKVYFTFTKILDWARSNDTMTFDLNTEQVDVIGIHDICTSGRAVYTQTIRKWVPIS